MKIDTEIMCETGSGSGEPGKPVSEDLGGVLHTGDPGGASAASCSAERAHSESDLYFSSLMQSAQNGNQEAYRRLLVEIEPVLARKVRSRVMNTEDAAEVVQDILLSLHLARDSYEPDRSFGAWLRSITHHRLADYFRRVYRIRGQQGTGADELSQQILDTIPSADASPDFRIDMKRLANSLPVQQQRLLSALLSHEDELDALARELSLSPGNLRVQLHRLKMRILGGLSE